MLYLQQVLNLNDNTLTEKGSEAVAAVLPDLQDIRIIDLGECIVRSDGAMVLAKALENGHKKLEVEENRLFSKFLL